MKKKELALKQQAKKHKVEKDAKFIEDMEIVSKILAYHGTVETNFRREMRFVPVIGSDTPEPVPSDTEYTFILKKH